MSKLAKWHSRLPPFASRSQVQVPQHAYLSFILLKLKIKKCQNIGIGWIRTLVGREQRQTKHAKKSTRPTYLFCNKTTQNNIYWFKIVEKFGYLSIQPVIRLFCLLTKKPHRLTSVYSVIKTEFSVFWVIR